MTFKNFIFTLLSCLVLHAAQASNPQNRLDISERYYQEGAYLEALDHIEKTISRSKRRQMDQWVAELNLYKAKYLEALGRYNEMEELVPQILDIKSAESKESALYVDANLRLAKRYADYSNYTQAQQYLQEAEEYIEKLKAQDNWGVDLEYKLQLAKSAIYLGQGLYSKALDHLPLAIEAADTRTKDTRKFFDSVTGTFSNTTRLSASQKRELRQEKADVLTLLGAAYRLKGDYKAADSALTQSENYIRAELRQKDPTFVRMRLQRNELRLDRGDNPADIRKELENDLFLAERLLGLVHKDYLALQELIIDYYFDERYLSKNNLERWEINTNTGLYFGDGSLRNAVAERLDAKKDYSTGSFNAAYRKLIRLYNDTSIVPVNHVERANVLRQLYDLSLAQDSLDAAEKYLTEYVEAEKRLKGESSLGAYYGLLYLGDFYQQYTNRFDLADSLIHAGYSGAMALVDSSHREVPGIIRYMVRYHELKGNYDSADYYVNQVNRLEENRYGREDLRYAIGLADMTDLDIETGRFRNADLKVEDMLSSFQQNSYKRRVYDQDFARVLETTAKYYATVGLYDQATESLSKATRLMRRSGAVAGNSNAKDELAYLYLKTGDYKRTETLLDEVISNRIKRFGPNNRFLIRPYNQLALLNYINGEYIEADSIANLALFLVGETFGENAIQETESRKILADVYSAMGNYDRGKEEINKVIELEKEKLGEQHVKLATSYTQLALINLFSGEAEIELIEGLLQKALSIISVNMGEDNPIYATALKNLAMVLIEEGRYEDAETALVTAANIWSTRLRSAQNINSAEITMLLGDIDLRTGNYSGAVDKYYDVRQTYKSLFNKNHPEYVKALGRLGRGYFMLKDFKKSRKYTEEALDNYLTYIDQFFPALSSREKTRYWLLIKNDFEFYTNLAVYADNNKKMLRRLYDNTLATKALLLSSSIKIRNRIMNSGDSTLVQNYLEWIELKDQMTKALALNEDQQVEDDDPKVIQSKIEEIEKQLSARSSYFDEQSKKKFSTWKDIRKTLEKDEAALEIIRFRKFDKTFTDEVLYAGLVVSRQTSSKPDLAIIKNGKDLEKRNLAYYRTCVEFGLEDKYSYNAYWKPIFDITGPGKKIFVSAEGVYNQINLETLIDSTGTYLLDKQNLFLVSSTKDLLKTPEVYTVAEGEKQKIQLIGNPIFYADLPVSFYNRYNSRAITQLPGTFEEVKTLETLLENSGGYTTDVYTTIEATEDVVKNLNSPKVFHIATHGFFLEDQQQEGVENDLAKERAVSNPLLRSGLLLKNAGDLMASKNVYAFNKAPGVLTAYEAMNLNLDHTELVVLSACETGRGDNKVGEGVYGLQRAFLVAGAETIIMSLFEVSDVATLRLMELFYENWINKGMDKRAAFADAKKTLRSEFKEPKYWGAFIMVGTV